MDNCKKLDSHKKKTVQKREYIEIKNKEKLNKIR